MDAKAQADLEEARKAGIDLNLIDCNLALTPEQRIERHQGALELDLYGRTCRVFSRGDLIKAKQAAGREKDLLVARELRAIAAKKGIVLE